MSGLCGWLGAAGAQAIKPDIAAMVATLTRFDGSPAQITSAASGAVATASRSARADVFQDETYLIAVHGRPRFTDPELAAAAERRGPAFALREAYLRRGTSLFAAIEGSFALAILDYRGGTALLAIDRMGTQSLSYAAVGGTFAFGSTLDALKGVADREINPQAIYDFVYFHMVPAPQTIYARCRRLLPGTFVTWDGSEPRTTRYWQMRFVEDEKTPLPELKEKFLSVLRKSISDAAADARVGAFLSGGTDSSTVAGMLREVTGEAPRTYSIGFDAEGFDEVSYARIAAQHFGTRHHEYYVTPDDVVDAIPRIAAVHDQPFGNSSAVPTYYCAKLAREDGVDTLLGGDGGDELFGGNARYATQYLYSLYGDLPAAVRKRLIEPIVQTLPAISLIGKAQRYIRTASQPMPARYDNYNLVERLGAGNIFTADFLSTVNAREPSEQCERAYREAQGEALINRMLAFDFKYTLADNDLLKVTRSCELAAVQPRFPLLDDAVVAFSARLAPELKLKGVQLRYFFKEALNGFLPPEIIAKRKHGFGLPFGRWLQAHDSLRQLALDSLSDLKKRMIVRPTFVEELTERHVGSHADYYGTMVWVLIMLELWFRQHHPYNPTLAAASQIEYAS
jgi:asparagine synthase (glutamine-hydrolysing)